MADRRRTGGRSPTTIRTMSNGISTLRASIVRRRDTNHHFSDSFSDRGALRVPTVRTTERLAEKPKLSLLRTPWRSSASAGDGP